MTSVEAPPTRAAIAAAVYRIVCEFADVDPRGDQPLAGEAATTMHERRVAELAEQAESNTVWRGGRRAVLYEVLPATLRDDYWRIKRGEQWMAFANDLTS